MNPEEEITVEGIEYFRYIVERFEKAEALDPTTNQAADAQTILRLMKELRKVIDDIDDIKRKIIDDIDQAAAAAGKK